MKRSFIFLIIVGCLLLTSNHAQTQSKNVKALVGGTLIDGYGSTPIRNSVVIIEHNLDVIRSADWIIDLGPEGGEEGGRIVAQGAPEQVARNKRSYTGQALAEVLGKMKSATQKTAKPCAEPALTSP